MEKAIEPNQKSDSIKGADTFLSARWEDLIMANYAVDPAVLKPYLPAGVELDFHDGQTYVSLVGFMFKKTSPFGIPIPFLGTFEEINLRFYVTRKQGMQIKRGVVFFNETVPYQAVAWLANLLYNEHYTAVPTKNSISVSEKKLVKYEWRTDKAWNSLEVEADLHTVPMTQGSIEEFIFEHYFGYTKTPAGRSQEYRVEHPRWMVRPVGSFEVNCDFEAMYGADFKFLQDKEPDSVIFADGSDVKVDWKRVTF